MALRDRQLLGEGSADGTKSASSPSGLPEEWFSVRHEELLGHGRPKPLQTGGEDRGGILPPLEVRVIAAVDVDVFQPEPVNVLVDRLPPVGGNAHIALQ